MTPEETFREIARLMNKLLEFEADYDFGVNPNLSHVPTYLLGEWNEDAGNFDARFWIRYNDYTGRYQVHKGDPND